MLRDVIADLPYDERPRERMSLHGASSLSDAELLALVLGSGVPGKNAIDLARELLSDGKASLAARPVVQLAKVHGMGPAKAARICATVELARRFATPDHEPPPLFDAGALGRSLIARWAVHQQERLGGVFLDARFRILKQRIIYVGTIDHALVSTRDVIRYAMQENAIGIVLYHNHPSGDCAPSEQDIAFTEKMRDSLSLCDLRLVDHVIVGSKRYLSMRETGYM